ncbi:MAG: histidine phosphatase family protein [Lachnospiraceae bacterium]|nr:histidine phosphatase family protein [Lachnospiraceae bacterium]
MDAGTECRIRHKKIVSSDLPRARETAEIISARLGLPVTTDERLREADNGDLAGMLNEEALQKYPRLFWNLLKPEECYPNGESPNRFYIRIKMWFEVFLKEHKDADGNILVVTHGGVINVVYHLVKCMEWSNTKKPVPVGNCSVHVLDTVQMEISEKKTVF